MEPSKIRAGATIKNISKGIEGKITGIQHVSKHLRLIVEQRDGSEVRIDRRYAAYISPPTFLDPVKLYLHRYILDAKYSRSRGEAPASVDFKRGYIPVLFNKDKVQGIIKGLEANKSIEWEHVDFYKFSSKLKAIYLGFD